MSSKYGIGKIVAHEGHVYIGVDEHPSVGDKALVIANTCHHGFDLGSVIDVSKIPGHPYETDSIFAKDVAGFEWALRSIDYVTLKPAAEGMVVKRGDAAYTLAIRQARVGEQIVVRSISSWRVAIDEFTGFGRYNVGDVLTVTSTDGHLVDVKCGSRIWSLGHGEYPGGNSYYVLEPVQTCPFAVGDKVVGTADSDDHYGHTTSKALMEVVGVGKFSFGDIRVKVIQHSTDPFVIGETFSVQSQCFELAPTAPSTPKFSRGDKVRVKTSRSLYGSRIDSSQPHTFHMYEGKDQVCIVTPNHNFRSVSLNDIEPWVEPTPMFKRGDKVRVKTSKSFYGRAIDTSKPHVYKSNSVYDGYIFVVPCDGGSDVKVKISDVQPWVDEPTLSPAMVAMAEYAAAVSTFADAAKALESATNHLVSTGASL